MTVFDLARHHRDRIRDLDRRVTTLDADNRRLYRLLGLALLVATSDGRECSPQALLAVVCAIDGTDPARPAWVEEEERQQSAAETERLIVLLRETNPDRARGGAAT